ncbi:MAG: POTRA domain-containing protein [Candidatus Kapabacteria bacterium]|nr:POTRA domain-containing protein [Candidatus Kapabacteria bacterium]
MKKNVLAAILAVACAAPMHAQDRIGNIILSKKNVFDTTKYQWEFVEKIANSLHVVTKDYVIEDELLFKFEDEYNDDLLYETERNLRSLGIFSNVKVEIDSAGNDFYDVYVSTQDNWTTNPSLLIGTGGSESCIGGRLEERNLAGTNTTLMVEGLYRTENNIHWQGRAAFRNRRIFRLPVGLSGELYANRFRTEQNANIYNNFDSQSDKYAFSLRAENKFGDEFMYNHGEGREVEDLRAYSSEQTVSMMFARGWKYVDRVYVSTLLEYHRVDREFDRFKRAFDNMGRFLIAFSSSAEDFVPMTKIDGYSVEDVPVGGWGNAVLGRIFPIGDRGEHPMYYVAAQIERSYLSDNQKFYLFGQVSASTAFLSGDGRNTYEEFLGLGFYKISPQFTLAGRIRQQNVWNWSDDYRQLLLDNEHGVRGYRLNELRGDNRIYANVELRFFPENVNLWFFKFGMNAFWDCGSVWSRNTQLAQTEWRNSAGVGLRFYNDKGGESAGVFRFDFAYNFDEGKLGEVIFSTNQFFTAFGIHAFEAPRIYGTENDLD